MTQKIVGYLEAHKEEMVALAGRLVGFNTANPPGNGYEELVAYAKGWLEEAGLHVRVVSVPEAELAQCLAPECRGPRPALIAELNPDATGPVLCFQGHYDTVPVCEGWTRAPHTPIIEEGRLYGLGATDMKSGLAAMMMACKALAQCGVPLSGRVVFATTPDEEYASKANLRYFLERNYIKADYAIVGEFSGIDNLYVGMKGATWGDIAVRGKSAHGSTPGKGINAFDKLVDVVNALNQSFRPRLLAQETEFSVLPGEELSSTLMLGGMLQSPGAARSMVPTYAKVSFDMRTVPSSNQQENEQALLETVHALRHGDADLDAQASIASSFPGFVVSPNTAFCQTSVETIREVTGAAPSLNICSAALETAFFNQFGTPALAYGPGIPQCAHAADEYVVIDDMLKAAKIYTLLAAKLLAQQ